MTARMRLESDWDTDSSQQIMESWVGSDGVQIWMCDQVEESEVVLVDDHI